MINKKLFSREEGQGLVEYALILVLVAIVVIAVLLLLGPAVGQTFCRVANTLKPGTCGVLGIISGPTANEYTAGKYEVTVTVSVAEPTSVTFNAGGKSQTKSCTGSCSLTVSNVPQNGSYSITTTSGASLSGNY